jgi:hypothetical protein
LKVAGGSFCARSKLVNNKTPMNRPSMPLGRRQPVVVRYVWGGAARSFEGWQKWSPHLPTSR